MPDQTIRSNLVSSSVHRSAPGVHQRLVRCATLLAALLTGCGGGVEEVTPVVAESPTSVTVAEGAMAPFQVRPLYAPNGESVEWSVDGAVIPGEETNTLTWGPVQLGDDGKQFAATLVNTKGRATSTNATLSVTPRAWSEGVDVGAADTGIRERRAKPLVVTAGNGRTYALITRFDINTRATLWLARREVGADAFTIVRMVRGGGSGPNDGLIGEMALAADGAGRAVMVWREDARGQSNVSSIWASVEGADAAGTVGRIEAQRISSVTSELAIEPTVTAATAGEFEVAWTERTNANATSRIISRRLVHPGSTGSFSAPVPADLGDADSFSPQLGSDASGNITMVWVGRLGANSNSFGIFANRRAAGSVTWNAGDAVRIDQLPGTATAPQLRVNSAGAAGAIWHENTQFGSGNVYWAQRTPGQDWQTSAPVAQWSRFQEPAFALCSNGDAAIVSLPDGFDGQRLHHWRYESAVSGGTWTAPTFVNEGDGGYDQVSAPQVGCDAANNHVVSWTYSYRDLIVAGPAAGDVRTLSQEVRARRFIATAAPHHAGAPGFSGWLNAHRVSGAAAGGEFATDAGLAVATDGSATLVFNRAVNASNMEAWVSARLR